MKTNDSLGLTPEEHALVLTGIQAMDEMGKRTFEHWIDGIGPALKMLKTKPGADNHMRWKTIREEAGFGKIDGAVVSRLLTIMQDENIGPVRKWYASLPTNKQFAYCSPASIMRQCPHFNKSPKDSAPPRETQYEKLKTAHSIALEELDQLKKKLGKMESTPRRGSVATPKEFTDFDAQAYWAYEGFNIMNRKLDLGMTEKEILCAIHHLVDGRGKTDLAQAIYNRMGDIDNTTPPPATHDAGVDGNESESEPEAASPPASSVPTAGVSAFKDIPLSKETTKLAQKMVEVAQSKARPKKTKLKKAKPKAEPKKTKPKRGTVRKIAAAVKTAKPTKTAEPEFADDYDGITWKPKDGGCEGRTDGVNGAWAIIPTIESDRYFVAFHPHGVMSIEDRKEIGTFPTIEEAQAACEADRVATS